MAWYDGLKLYLPPPNPTTGATATDVRPETQGELRTVNEPQAQGSTGLFDVLNDIGGSIGAGLNNIIESAAAKKAKELSGDVDANDTTGVVSDQPGSVVQQGQTFIKRYQTELIVGGVVLAVAGVLYAVTR